MNHKEYIRSLSREERGALAEFAGTSLGYINNLAYQDDRLPSLPLACLIEIFSKGKCSRQDIFPDFLGDLVNPASQENHRLFPEFDIPCRIRTGFAEPTDNLLHVHCAGAAIYIDLPDRQCVAMNGEEASALAEALQRAIVAHLVGKSISKTLFAQAEISVGGLTRAS